MKKYLSHWSAIKYWNVPFVQSSFKKEMEAAAEEEFTVFSKDGLDYHKSKNIHLCTTPVPTSMKCEDNGVLVVSLELALLQVAQELEMHQIIFLAILLCGRPRKKYQTPASSKQKMMRRISATAHHDGKRKVLRALNYVEDSCRSPMEALLFMMLRLPYSLGGYGLTGGVFDHKVKLTDEHARLLNQTSIFADIYFASIRLFVEYDSKEWHTDPKDLARDAQRNSVIIRQNYKLLNLRTEQLYDAKKFDVFVKNVASALGQKIRIRNSNHTEMNQRIRSLFPVLKDMPLPEKKW